MRDGYANKFIQGHLRLIGPKTEFTVHAIPNSITSTSLTAHRGGPLPVQIIIAQVETKSIMGSRDTNPFYFQRYGLEKINLRINGTVFPPKGIKMSWSSIDDQCGWITSYIHMTKNLGTQMNERTNMITPKHFKDGAAFICFDLSPSGTNGLDLQDMKEGRVEVDMHWDSARTKAMSVLIYVCYQCQYILNPRNATHPFDVGIF